MHYDSQARQLNQEMSQGCDVTVCRSAKSPCKPVEAIVGKELGSLYLLYFWAMANSLFIA